jgi:hypothetical protein
MIQFVASSVKHAALGVTAGVSTSVMAIQSLNMDLSILTRANVPMEDWEKMLASADDLKTLEDYADQAVRKVEPAVMS